MKDKRDLDDREQERGELGDVDTDTDDDVLEEDDLGDGGTGDGQGLPDEGGSQGSRRSTRQSGDVGTPTDGEDDAER